LNWNDELFFLEVLKIELIGSHFYCPALVDWDIAWQEVDSDCFVE